MSYESIDSSPHEFDERLTHPLPQLDAKRGCLLTFFVFISGVTALTATFVIASVATFMIISSSRKDFNVNTLMHFIIQLYDVILCIAVVVIEMEWTDAIHKVSLLQSWSIRGLCYCFVGLIINQELGTFFNSPLSDVQQTYLQLPSALLIVLGIIYSLMVRKFLARIYDSIEHSLSLLKEKYLFVLGITMSEKST